MPAGPDRICPIRRLNMHNEALYNLRKKNVLAALAHQEGDYVPILANASSGGFAYAGKTVPEVFDDPRAYASAVNKVYDDMWADCIWTDGIIGTIGLEEAMDVCQYKLAPDNVTLTHVQIPCMEKEDYEEFCKDPDRFVLETLVPRRYPKMFEDREWAKNALKTLAEKQSYILGTLFGTALWDAEENSNVVEIVDFQFMFENPLDILFDHMRGFRGTLLDLRRSSSAVKEACGKLWELRCEPLTKRILPGTFPYPVQFTHMPNFLSPKQYREIYWPYEKAVIEWAESQGSKMIILMEGKWENIYECFLEVPKDSCVLVVDEDDIFKLKDRLGDHQIIAGGQNLMDMRLENADTAISNGKKVIDHCAPGGGFILTTNKAWISPGDINANMVETMNALHEYSLK